MLQIMKNLIPQLEIISLCHQRTLITVADVLNNPIFSLQLEKLLPIFFLVFLLLCALEVISLDFLLDLESLLSVF
jgi:hypothetical protein